MRTPILTTNPSTNLVKTRPPILIGSNLSKQTSKSTSSRCLQKGLSKSVPYALPNRSSTYYPSDVGWPWG